MHECAYDEYANSNICTFRDIYIHYRNMKLCEEITESKEKDSPYHYCNSDDFGSMFCMQSNKRVSKVWVGMSQKKKRS